MVSRRAINVGNYKKTNVFRFLIRGFLPFPLTKSVPFIAYQRKYTAPVALQGTLHYGPNV